MSFDFIVVGAGSSGATIAGLLAQRTDASVLLLEAGPDYRSKETPKEMRGANSLKLDDPAFSEFWWNPPVRYTRAQDPVPFERGKGLGGCSAVNCQVAIRGPLDDYDGWAAEGCTGWSGKEILKSFIRLESDLDFPSAPYHGSEGPLPIARPGRRAFGPIDEVLADGAIALGNAWADDYNAPGATGVSPAAMNSHRGVRVSTNDAYLEPARTRQNLTIVGGATVDRILLDGRRASGVRCRVGGEWRTLRGSEVILSAGVLNSPAILMRSGIGPRDRLEALGIGCVHHNASVGANLSDHASIFMEARLPEAGGAHLEHRYPVGCIARFTSGIGSAGFNDMGLGSFNFWGAEGEGCDEGALFVTLFQSFSKGSVALNSSDPDADLETNFEMLSTPTDLERMKHGVRLLVELGSRAVATGQAKGVTIGDVEVSAGVLPAGDELAPWLLSTVDTIGHPCGTCRMGSADDPRSVVDPDCRVVGVDGLRVADASVIPETPRANNHLSCVMVGEHLVARMLDET